MTAATLQPAPDFDRIDIALGRAHGLATCLEELAREFPGLCNPSPMACGINALIQTVRGELENLQTVIDAERKNK